MKRPFVEPTVTEEASLADVTLTSGSDSGYDLGAQHGA